LFSFLFICFLSFGFFSNCFPELFPVDFHISFYFLVPFRDFFLAIS
jgi:hypothetical protein